MQNNIHFPKSHTWLIATGSQTVAYSASAGSLTHITNSGGTATNLANGKLGVLMAESAILAEKNNFLVTGYTAADCPVIQIVQGTPGSATLGSRSPYPISHKSYVASARIDSRNPIRVIQSQFRKSKYETVVMGDLAANAGAIQVPAAGVDYRVKIGFDGVRSHREFSQSDIPVLTEGVRKESTSYANEVDRLIKRLAYKINTQSSFFSPFINRGVAGNRPIIAFAINIAGGVGVKVDDVATGSATTLPFMVINGVTHNYTIDEDLKAAFADAITNTVLTTASTVEVINLTTAGSNATVTGTLSSNAILFVSRDYGLAIVDDRVNNTKVNLRVTLNSGFSSAVNLQTGSRAYPGSGYGRELYLEYLKNARQQIYSQETIRERLTIVPPHYFDVEAGLYNVTTILHNDSDTVDVRDVHHGHITSIVVPCSLAGVGNSTVVDSLNDDGLADWLRSVPGIQIETPATAPDIFI